MKNCNLLAILLLSLFSHNTFAYQPTEAELHQNSALCSYGYNSNCGSTNYSFPKVTITRLPSRYGAVASGLTRNNIAYFDAHNELSAKIAKKKALTKCRQAGIDECSIAADYSDQCISSAVGIKNKLYETYFGFDLSQNLANHDALEKCKNDNAEQCHLFKVAGCSLY